MRGELWRTKVHVLRLQSQACTGNHRPSTDNLRIHTRPVLRNKSAQIIRCTERRQQPTCLSDNRSGLLIHATLVPVQDALGVVRDDQVVRRAPVVLVVVGLQPY